MRKTLPYLALFVCSSSALFGDLDLVHVDMRIAAFYPQSSLFREIYGNWQVDYELEVGTVFFRSYELWAHADWMSTNGNSSLGSSTSFSDFNVSLGGKYLFRFGPMYTLYLGLGVNGAFVSVNNSSEFVKGTVNKEGIGGVGKLGFYFEPVPYFYVDLFADYLYQQIHFHKWEQVGGIKIGGGFGFCF
jgi:hypothetical protein